MIESVLEEIEKNKGEKTSKKQKKSDYTYVCVNADGQAEKNSDQRNF